MYTKGGSQTVNKRIDETCADRGVVKGMMEERRREKERWHRIQAMVEL